MSYWTGLVSGFQESREGNITRQMELDKARRGEESKIFEYLLQSNDPEMRALALTGLLESARPGQRKGGLAGYLGDIQGGQMYPQVLARMNEQVPDEGVGGGPAPPRPGSAAMSTNVPVEAGSEPMQLPGQALPQEAAPPGMAEPPPGPTVSTEGQFGQPPPVSKWKRRGTGVPTAEEIAEMNATAPIRARIKMITEELTRRGAPPEVIQRAILGIAGAPQNQRLLSAVTQWGVRLQPGGPVLPVLLDQNGGYTLSDGTPVPPTAEMVRMSGAGVTGALSSFIRDSPESRAQLIERGADPRIVNAGSPSGFFEYRTDLAGNITVNPSEFTPPPAYSGTTEILDPSRVPVRAPILRGGGVGAPLGDIADTVSSQTQTDAQSLLQIVDRIVADTWMPGLPISPASRDQAVQQEAQKLNLPYRTYGELVRATRSTPPITPRQRSEGGTLAERVRERALRNREGGAAGPPAPPPRPPIRSTGPGPLR